MDKNKKIATISAILISGALGIGGFLMTEQQNEISTQTISNITPTPIQEITSTPVPTLTISITSTPGITKTPSQIPKQQPRTNTSTAITNVLDIIGVSPIPEDTLREFVVSVNATYEISKIDSNRTGLKIKVPDKLGADMFELYLNKQYIDKQLLPDGRIIAPPLVFTDKNTLEIRIIKLNKVIGIGNFKNDKLEIRVKEAILDE